MLRTTVWNRSHPMAVLPDDHAEPPVGEEPVLRAEGRLNAISVTAAATVPASL
jgi:hypothetical protein